MKPYATSIERASYWEVFKDYYTPQLKKIDLLIKTMEGTISIEETSQVLLLSEDYVKKIMEAKKITLIDKEGFLSILMDGNSSLCGLLQREFMLGSPSTYSPGDIAYIYGLQKEHVENVCQTNGFTGKISAEVLPKVLDKVFVFVYH